MKEQTLEELVEEIHYDITNSFRKDDILKLLKQVREATIKECTKSIKGECKNYSPFEGRYYQLSFGEQIYNLNKIKTDSIKIPK